MSSRGVWHDATVGLSVCSWRHQLADHHCVQPGGRPGRKPFTPTHVPENDQRVVFWFLPPGGLPSSENWFGGSRVKVKLFLMFFFLHGCILHKILIISSFHTSGEIAAVAPPPPPQNFRIPSLNLKKPIVGSNTFGGSGGGGVGWGGVGWELGVLNQCAPLDCSAGKKTQPQTLCHNSGSDRPEGPPTFRGDWSGDPTFWKRGPKDVAPLRPPLQRRRCRNGLRSLSGLHRMAYVMGEQADTQPRQAPS